MYLQMTTDVRCEVLLLREGGSDGGEGKGRQGRTRAERAKRGGREDNMQASSGGVPKHARFAHRKSHVTYHISHISDRIPLS